MYFFPSSEGVTVHPRHASRAAASYASGQNVLKYIRLIDGHASSSAVRLAKLELSADELRVSEPGRSSVAPDLPTRRDFGCSPFVLPLRQPGKKKTPKTASLSFAFPATGRPSRRPARFWPRSYPRVRAAHHPPAYPRPDVQLNLKRYWSGWWRRASTPTGPRDVPLDTQGRIKELSLFQALAIGGLFFWRRYFLASDALALRLAGNILSCNAQWPSFFLNG